MAPTTQSTQDPALAQAPTNPPATQPQPGVPPPLTTPDLTNVHISSLDQNQIINLLRHLPNMFGKLAEQNNPKEDAAQALSNLAAHPVFATAPVHYPPPGTSTGLPGINDPGPSSHPRGPPNLGQLSAVALQATPVDAQQTRPENAPGDNRNVQQMQAQQSVQGVPAAPASPDKPPTTPTSANATTPAGRRGRNPAMGTDEWTRQRKDNHKEVERRRRGNINEGINELGRIVPSGNGEKAKGAILARAVQYIHHLKENEARNIEKWTLEKLLMDQAMGDLQAQLEEVKRMWEEERNARQRLEAELGTLRNNIAAAAAANNAAAAAAAAAAPQSSAQQQAGKTPDTNPIDANNVTAKRKSEEVAEQTASSNAEGDAERESKRQRTD